MNEQEGVAIAMERLDGESTHHTKVEDGKEDATNSHESKRVSQTESETAAEHESMHSPDDSKAADNNDNNACLSVGSASDTNVEDSSSTAIDPGSNGTHETLTNDQENTIITSSHKSTSKTSPKDTYTFTKLDFLVMLFSTGTYLFDIGSDIWVAVLHFRNGDFWWFGLTLAFVFLPCVVMTIVFLVPVGFGDAKNVMAMVIPGGYIYFYIQGMHKGVQVIREKDPQKKQKLQEDLISKVSDSAIVRLFEAFLEAAPQLVLQLYIMFRSPGNQNHFMAAVQWLAIGTSLASLCWTLASNYKYNRLKNKKGKVSHSGMASIFIRQVFIVGPRVFAIALFAYCSGYGVFILIGIHYIIMLYWKMRQISTDLCQLDCGDFGLSVVIAFVFIFCYFVPLKKGPTRLQYALYYTLVYMENVGMLFTWYFTTESPLWLQYLACALIMGGFFIGIFFQVIYYVEFHPNNSREDPRHHIQIWVPLSDLKFVKTKKEGV